MFSLYLVQDDVTNRPVSGDERTLYDTCVLSQGSGSRNPCLRVVCRACDSICLHTRPLTLSCALCCSAVRSGSVGSDCALIDL